MPPNSALLTDAYHQRSALRAARAKRERYAAPGRLRNGSADTE